MTDVEAGAARSENQQLEAAQARQSAALARLNAADYRCGLIDIAARYVYETDDLHAKIRETREILSEPDAAALARRDSATWQQAVAWLDRNGFAAAREQLERANPFEAARTIRPGGAEAGQAAQ